MHDTTPPRTGMTLKQFARAAFNDALDAYRAALESGDSKRIVATSVAVHAASSGAGNHRHARALINRVFRETKVKATS